MVVKKARIRSPPRAAEDGFFCRTQSDVLTTVSVTDPVDDPVNDSVNGSVTDVVNYPLFLMYIERL